MNRTVWTRREVDAIDVAFVLSSVVLAGIHLYLGLLLESVPATVTRPFVLVGVTFLAIVPVYFTEYWRPVLYPLVAAYALFLGVLWALGGMEYPTVGTVTGFVATVFVLLSLYLYYRDAPSPIGE